MHDDVPPIVVHGTKTDNILCGKEEDGTTALASPIATTGSFTTFCELIDSGPFSLSNGNEVDLVEYLNGSVGHTVIAPTDAAFDKIAGIVNAVEDLATGSIAEKQAYHDIVANWLQLHILGDTYLTEDFTCDDTTSTINLGGMLGGTQRQKTKCRGQANLFNQIGGGNVGDSDQPTVGGVSGVFTESDFADVVAPENVVTSGDAISTNVIGCNGVIHVVDAVLQPGGRLIPDYYTYGYYQYYGTKGAKGGRGRGKAGKGNKYQKYLYWYGRKLNEDEMLTDGPADFLEDATDADRETERENRRARLESMLVDGNGNIEPMN